MTRTWICLAASAAVLLVAGAALLRTPEGAGAQEAAATIYVTGLRIEGKKARAIVRLTNVSPSAADVYGVHYTVQAVDDGVPLSLPGAGYSGAQLLPGRTLELDLDAVVTAYRRSFDLGPYKGPVRFVAFGEGGTYLPFGPDTVQVSAVQTEGAARFEPFVDWR